MKIHQIVLLSLLFTSFGFIQCNYAQDKTVNVKELMDKKPGILIDVRTVAEWNSGHHKLAKHHDWTNGDFEKASMNFDKNKTYYLYCAAGGRSGQATEFLKSKGFKNVVNLGGYSNLK
ncbi:MAG: rhodanese-like domain-containing protein [Saprospiraceae bacterium]|nr:rhodanese-like domain-containing protein [Saprospiraceae bacterium]MBK9632034.1 rhodanese-like domain-containing protein [Saprospiraceae bacterium]